MEGEESLLDSIFDAENVEDMEDVDMVDVEEGELVENDHQAEVAGSSKADVNAVSQEPQSKNKKRRNKKKKSKKRKSGSGSGLTDINKFVLDTCRQLKERKSYLIWTAVGCLGVAALSDLVKEVVAIQACGGQKTADGRRHKTGGGILFSIIKARDPNAFKEIMKKGKEFEKQFHNPDLRKAVNQSNNNKQACSEAEAQKAEAIVEDAGKLAIVEEKQEVQKRPVHDRIRVPVSYDDLLEIQDPKDKAI